MTKTDEEILGTEKPISTLIIGRAGGPTAEDSSVQVRISYRGEPTVEYLTGLETALRSTYEDTFNEEAERVAVVVLPFFLEYDEDMLP